MGYSGKLRMVGPWSVRASIARCSRSKLAGSSKKRAALVWLQGSWGEWAEDTALAAAVGKAFVMNQGCYSCHEISGMGAMMPIGAELTKWASKTVDKFGFRHVL